MLRVCLILISFISWMSLHAQGEESPEIKAAVQRGSAYLTNQIKTQHGGQKTLMALALFKAGTPGDSPELQTALQEIQTRCTQGIYRGADGIGSIYAAGLDATLLTEVDPQKYQSELKTIANYLLKHQLETGGWEYPDAPLRAGSIGDTSVTQYACLGLWAVQRAGIEVDPKIWGRVLEWHTKYQNVDGGFAYCPTTTARPMDSLSTVNMSINAVGSFHIAMLNLSPEYQPLRQSLEKKPEPAANKKFGVLEEFRMEPARKERAITISDEDVRAVRKAFSFVTARYTPLNNETHEFKAYFLYSLERMAALADVPKLGDHDWFRESSEALLKLQQPDGAWSLGQDRSGRDTAFSVLFLTRSTAKALNRVPRETGYGDGTLAGGRGLPDDLAAAKDSGRSMQGKNQPAPPLDQLLSALQNTGDVDLDRVQEQLVEQVQLGDRQALIGQIDLLRQLAENPQPEVRRTAVWAIGRSDRLDLGTILIQRLDDRDLGVIIEARNALCWLSKKPNGFGEAENPLTTLPGDATEQQKQDAIAAWHRQLVLHWGQWYLNVRPFADSGDLFEADLRRNLRRLKEESAPEIAPAAAPR